MLMIHPGFLLDWFPHPFLYSYFLHLKDVTFIRAVLLISAFVPVTNPDGLQTQPDQDVSSNHQEEPDQLELELIHTKKKAKT